MEKLQKLRIATGLSQKQFADRVGINIKTYQNYEQGYRSISNANINTILRVCKEAKCGLDEFIDDEECRAYYLELVNKNKAMCI